MIASTIGRTSHQGASFAAKNLNPRQRQALALAVLGHQRPVPELAIELGVSRNFCYEQAAKARVVLRQCFDPPPAAEEPVLFHLPVTPSWLRQFVVAQTLIGHTSARGVQELAGVLLDHPGLSLGTIHNILQEAADQARELNDQEDRRCLPAIAVGAHDEIFQAGQPVLAGVDVQSLYCYLLSVEEHRDETTWGVHLLELTEKGLNLQRSIADFGSGLRAGQKAAWGKEIRCDGDVFHGLKPLTELAGFLEHQALAAIASRQEAQKQWEACWKADEVRRFVGALTKARREEAQAVQLSDDITLLVQWVREDVLGLAGEDLATRVELLGFIVEQLRERESLCEHRIQPVRRMLQKQGSRLLGFVGEIDRGLAQLAGEFGVEEYWVRAACRLEALDRDSAAYWQRRGELAAKLGQRWGAVEAGVKWVLQGVARSSSLVENLNSRLRCYLFLRRQVGEDWLELLRFYLNHRCLQRSRRKQRAGRSPAELLRSQTHPHWLEMLGYRLFRRSEAQQA